MSINKTDINEVIVLKIMKFYYKHSDMSDESIKYLYFGLYTIVSTLSKMIIIILLSLILGLFKETIILMSIMFSIRYFSGGIHMKSSFSCTIVSILFYIGGSFISSYHLVNCKLCLILSIFFSIFIIKYSPCETEKRPIKEADKRKKLKIITAVVLTAILVINICIKSNLLFNITLLAFLSQSIFVNPLTYNMSR